MAGIYVHLPFCHSKCAYCDFYSSPHASAFYDRYVKCLIGEFSARRGELGGQPVTTLYLGGGTPSMLPAALTSRLIDQLRADLPKGSIEEATIEANPEDVTPEWIEAMAAVGINRVSMGVQSFNDEELKAIGRRHSAAQAIDAALLIKKSGLRFNLDLIYGLPGQSLDSWRRNLDTAMAIDPGHLSAYLLSYEPGTRLWAMMEAGKVEEADEELAQAMYALLTATARDNRYVHYEISNFARPGNEAIHNTNYWRGIPYLGLGAAAHSFDGLTRRYNPSSISGYIDAIDSHGTAYSVDEETATDRLNDMIITRLRTAKGLSIAELGRQFGPEAMTRFKAESACLLISGDLTCDNAGRYSIPEDRYLRSDAIMRQLLFV
jgi:oxygen-independent coproporphyrinogen-3 oxidase